jgi:hypothetical protein
MATTIDEMVIKLQLDIAGLKAQVNQATGQMHELGQRVEKQVGPVDKLKHAFEGLKAGLIGLGIGEVVAKMKEFASVAIEENKMLVVGLALLEKPVFI